MSSALIGETEPLLGRQRRSDSQQSRSTSPTDSVETESTKKMECVETTKHFMKKQMKSCCSKQTLKSKLPFLTWLPKYSLLNLQCDFIAGITVGLTVIPQGLAYAKIAGLPPQYGLYSAFMGCFVYFFLGTSKDITLGPTAIMSLMTATFALSPIDGDPTYAIVLCLITGCVQFLMGILKLGILVNFISYPVINAFTSAAAITIAFGQIKGILGLKNIPREFIHMVYETFKHIPDTKVWDMTMGLSCMVLLFLLKKMRTIQWKETPTPPNKCVRLCRYVVWLCGTAANAIIVISSAGVAAAVISQGYEDKLSITGHLKPGLPDFTIPNFSVESGNITISTSQIFSNIGAGFGIVPLLGLVELIAIGKAFARQNNYKIDPSQELIAIGLANMISCFVSSYPVTGSFSRTAVNSQSGVKTPASGIVTGSLILVALYVLTPLFYYIPNAALSAVIIMAVIQMVDVMVLKKLWKVNKLDLVPLVITFLSCLGVGMEYGILIGIGVSLLMLLYPMSRPGVVVSHGEVIVVSIEHGLLFPAIEYIQNRVLMENESQGKNKSEPVVVDCTHVTALDYSSIQGIIELIADFKKRNSKVVFSGFPKPVLEHLQNADVPDLLISSTTDEGCKLIREKLKSEHPIENNFSKSSLEPTVTVDFHDFHTHL